MALVLPNGPSFGRWSDNIASPSSDGIDYGTGVTPGTSSVDGSAVEILPALAHDCEYLVLAISGFAISGNDSSALLDILVDPAGGTSWATLISDLLAGYTSFMEIDAASGNFGIPLMYHFPIWIPAGTSIGAQARFAAGSTPAAAPRVVVFAAGGNKHPASWWCGQKVETVGNFNAASSRGQTHTAGASGSFSSWASLGSATASRAGAAQFAVQGPGSGAVVGKVYRFEFGAGSNRIGPPVYRGMGGQEVGTHFFPGPVFCDIPAGTQMQVRGACGVTSPQTLDVAAYLVQ
jgi:hypothetical protein